MILLLITILLVVIGDRWGDLVLDDIDDLDDLDDFDDFDDFDDI